MRGTMKIVHVLRTPVGGLFRHVCDLAGAQAARGHEVGVIFDSSTADALTSVGLQSLSRTCSLGMHGLPMHRSVSPRDVTSLMAARRIVRTLEAEVVHGHGAKGGALARLAVAGIGGIRHAAGGRASRPGVFYTPHGGSLHFDPGSAAGLIFLGLERLLDRWTDGLIFEKIIANIVICRRDLADDAFVRSRGKFVVDARHERNPFASLEFNQVTTHDGSRLTVDID